MNPAALTVENLSVRFGGISALRNVDLTINSGEVLGLIGANGAGKSTLMKVLAGAIPAGNYQGAIRRNGREVRFRTLRDAEANGIGLVPQELVGVPELTVAENILLERYPRKTFGRIDWVSARREAEEALDAVGAEVSVDRPFSSLSASAQQMVQLARVVHGEADIVLLDEPTSSLSPPEVDRLLNVIRRIREAGRAVVLITHRLGEVFAVCDRLHILRDGRTAATRRAELMSKDEVVSAMLGQDLAAARPREARPPGRPVLEVTGTNGLASVNTTAVQDIAFTLHEGEVLGLFGLVGAGRTELLDILFGVHPAVKGSSIRLDGRDIANEKPSARLRAGLGFVTEDRKRTGLVLDLPIRSNITMSSLDRISRFGVLSAKRENETVRHFIDELGIRAPDGETPVRNLSGGNQQKVVLAKWLNRHPKVLLLDEPTRGIDVGAKAEVFRLLSDLAAKGMAILLVSSEVGEILSACDRALVMYRGRIVADMSCSAADEATLMRAATGLAAA